MSTILTYWQWQPFSAGLLLLLPLVYLHLVRYRPGARAGYFLTAWLLLALCLVSPLRMLSEQYLFSAHMTVHVLLLLVIAPLLVLSLKRQNKIGAWLSSHPWVAWLAGVGTMWLWHIPAIFNASMNHAASFHEWIHFAELLSFIAGGMIFIYPVFSARSNTHPMAVLVYLFSACIFCSLLGLLITFAPTGLYYHYLSAEDVYRLNNVIVNDWQFSQQDDQQAAGLIMWVPCCLIYILFSLSILKRWFSHTAVTNTNDQLNAEHGNS